MMTQDTATVRGDFVAAAIRRMRAIERADGVTRAGLARILVEVQGLAARRELWDERLFPGPDDTVRHARYLISEDEHRRFALYLNVMRPGRRTLPHNHTTWACIAAVDGVELNRLFERTDDGSRRGRATVVERACVAVGPVGGIALMPDDIHSVENPAGQENRHLHMYGRALETLTERIVFDPEAGTCRIMEIGVPTRR